MNTKPNIILFLTDDHGQWALGCYGNQELRTPNLDYLAATGVQMNNAFTPTPVCSPARACLFTGRLASQHGVHDYLASNDPEIDDHIWLQDETTLAQILSDGGYETALCGKWHIGGDEQPQPGFDYWFTLGGDYPVDHGGSHRFCDNGRMRQIDGYKTRIITDQAIQFLRRRDTSRPFFLVIGYTATHSPWQDHPERLVERYRGCTFADLPDDIDYPFGRQNLESTFATRENPREALAQYYAAVSQLDEGVGELLDEVEALDLRQESLFVYTSDHGLCCTHHGIWGKGNGTLPLNMVEESIRVPLIINQPGRLPQGLRREEFVDHLDLFQTLAACAAVDLPQSDPGRYPGRSFLPLLAGPAPAEDWRREQYGEYGPLRMIRTESLQAPAAQPGSRLRTIRFDRRSARNRQPRPGAGVSDRWLRNWRRRLRLISAVTRTR